MTWHPSTLHLSARDTANFMDGVESRLLCFCRLPCAASLLHGFHLHPLQSQPCAIGYGVPVGYSSVGWPIPVPSHVAQRSSYQRQCQRITRLTGPQIIGCSGDSRVPSCTLRPVSCQRPSSRGARLWQAGIMRLPRHSPSANHSRSLFNPARNLLHVVMAFPIPARWRYFSAFRKT